MFQYVYLLYCIFETPYVLVLMSIKTSVCLVILLVKNQIFFSSSSCISHPLLFDQRLYISLCLSGVLCEFILWMEQAVK